MENILKKVGTKRSTEENKSPRQSCRTQPQKTGENGKKEGEPEGIGKVPRERGYLPPQYWVEGPAKIPEKTTQNKEPEKASVNSKSKSKF